MLTLTPLNTSGIVRMQHLDATSFHWLPINELTLTTFFQQFDYYMCYICKWESDYTHILQVGKGLYVSLPFVMGLFKSNGKGVLLQSNVTNVAAVKQWLTDENRLVCVCA